MTSKFSLQSLLDLAQQKNEAALQKLGKLNRHQQAEQSRLDMLLQYRKDYQAKLQEAVRSGMSQVELENFRNFIQRLDEAIAQQRNANEHARNLLQSGREEFQETQRKKKSFDALAQRHADKERKLAEKVEQRQQDEHSGRVAAIKAAAAQNEN